jgi:hypothetical protein
MLGVDAPSPKAAAPIDNKARDAATLAQLPRGSAIYNERAASYAAKYGENPPVAEDAMITVTASKAKPKASAAGGAAAPKAIDSFSPAELRAGFGDKISDMFSPGSSSLEAALVSLEDFAKGGRVVGAMAPIDTLATRLEEIKAIAVDLSNVQIIDAEQIAAANQFSENLSRGLGQAIIYGQDIGDALISSIKAAAAELISSQLLKLLKGGDESGGILGAVASGVGALLGGRRAAGGPVQAGTPYLVGENRPEIFIPSTRGRIAPRVPAGGGAGATDVRIKVEPSDAFVTTVAVTAATSGQQAAAEAFRNATRGRMPGSRGA